MGEIKLKEAVIASAVRTAIGSFGGSLSELSAVDLGIATANEAVRRAKIRKDQIDEVIVGNVLSAGLGQNVARQISLGAEIPKEVPAMSLGMVCGSGLRAVSLAAQLIKAGDAEIVLAGGSESMSNSPYVIEGHRFGKKMGHNQIVDTMIKDGLWDIYNDYHMGQTAENIAESHGISRARQDEFALASQKKAEKAIQSGVFKDEIVPVTIPQRRGDPKVFDTDEYPKFGSSEESLAKLRPAFVKDGSVTAGNASGINDGAAMLVVCSKEKAEALSLPILAKITSYASAGVDPSVMGLGVVPAAEKALAKANLSIKDIDLAEANEAFAVQAIAVTEDLGIAPEKVNVNGGAIALGHPIGASGARILTTLLYQMKRQEAKTGLASLCIGGGMGTAVIVERYGS